MSEDRIVKNNTREEVYSGTYILDGLPISIEEQRNRIFEMMKKDGISVQNPEELEIIYEGADSDYGESETLSTKFTVYRKHMTPTKKQEQDEALKELEMLKALREQLKNAVDSHDREQIMEKITAISEGEVIPEEDSAVADEVVNPIDSELEDKDSLEEDIKKLSHTYDVEKGKMTQIVEEEQAELDGDTLLSDEEISAVRLGSLKEREKVLAELNSIVRDINGKRRGATLLQKDESLGQGSTSDTVISEDEEKLAKAIVPDEERVVIQEDVAAENDVAVQEDAAAENDEAVQEDAAAENDVTVQEDASSDNGKYPLAIIQKLYFTEGIPPMSTIARPIRLPETNYVVAIKNIETLPAKIVGTSIAPDYTPDKGPADMEDVQVGIPEEAITVEVYHDEDNDEVYLLKDTFDRFHKIPISEEKEINGKKCYQADKADVEEILSKLEDDNHFQVSHETVHLGKKFSVLPEEVKKDSDDLVERIVIYHDTEHDNVAYVRKHLFQRFSLEKPVGPEVLINGAVCYEISEEDAKAIMKNANNDYSPYRVEVRDVQIDKIEEPVVETPVVDPDLEAVSDESLDREESTGEASAVDSDLEAASDESLDREESTEETSAVDPDMEAVSDEPLNREESTGEASAVDSDDEEILPDAPYSFGPFGSGGEDILPDDPYSGIGHEEYEDVYESIDEIIDKLSEGLDLEKNIQEGAVKTFQNGRVNCTKLFFDELKNDDWEYNIVGALPAIITASAAFLKKISAHIIISLDSKERLEEVTYRLQDLSESELETLFAEYHDYSSNEENKSVIEPLIVDFIREYQYDMIEDYFASIKDSYQEIGSLKSLISENEQKKSVDKENESKYEESIEDYYRQAAMQVLEIKKLREEVSYYLDNDAYGLSQRYLMEGRALIRDVGVYRLNDDELAELAILEQALSDSIEAHDDKAIVDSFIQLEAFFGKHGKRISMGSLPIEYEETIDSDSSELSDEDIEDMIKGCLDEIADDSHKTL